MSRAGEFELIARFLAPLASDYHGALNLQDDAALIDTEDGLNRVITADTLVEGVHFMASDPPRRIAQKALRVNLSDLAAMGATPEVYTLALHIPERRGDEWVSELALGLRDDQKQFGIALIGGDTVGSKGATVLSVTAIGKIEPGKALRRSAAQPGDDIYVSGTIGDAGLGLRILTSDNMGLDDRQRSFAADRYRLPEPRVALGTALVGFAHACIDVSDGLVADLEHVAKASMVAARITLADVPSSPAAAAAVGYGDIDRVTAGDDYELLFTAAPKHQEAIRGISRMTEVRVRRIGQIEKGQGVVVVGADGKVLPIDRPGYRHR